MLVDSHCHLDCLDLTTFEGALDGVLAQADSQGVGHFLCVSINLEDYPAMLSLVENYPNISVSVGVHPNVTDGRDPQVDELIELAQHEKVVAIGETGLDYFRSSGDLSWQQDRFRRHIQAAKKVGKPIIVHSREAKQDTIDLLTEQHIEEVGGVMHCFAEDWAMAQQALALGMYISFSGIVTFKSATELKEVAQKVPLDRMLVETDCPYLAPVPHRGKKNQPAYVRYVAEYIAELRGVTFDEIEQATTQNYQRLFGNLSAN